MPQDEKPCNPPTSEISLRDILNGMLVNPRRESFAQSLARGSTVEVARVAAGYAKRSRHLFRMAKSAAIVGRIEQIIDQAQWEDPAQILPVIEECMRLAKTAGNLGTAAGIMAAGSLLEKAARLKERLPRRPMMQDVLEPEMSREEWIRTYATPA